MQQVPGQQRAKDFLLQLSRSERVPHALLFLGPTGSGSLALAINFARLLLCEQPGADSPCETCNACLKTSQLVHPDLHFSYPTIGTNAVSTDFIKEWRSAVLENPFLDVNAWLMRIGAENKQGNINKEECNAILKKLSLKAFEGRYKILVMWLPEYLGKEGNRLLKLIEEPPEQTVFLLVAENADLILPTILSRCQMVRIETLRDEDIIGHLREKTGLDPATAENIAFMADGDLNQALQMTAEADSDYAPMLLDWLRRCYRGNGPELVEWVDRFAQLGRENQKQLLQFGFHFMRELIFLMATGSDRLRLRPEEKTTAQNLARMLTTDKAGRLVQLLNDNYYYIERNANPKILFLDTSIRINQILKN